MQLKSVVLPAPFGPIIPSMSPSSIVNEMLSRTKLPEYAYESLSISTTSCILDPPSDLQYSASSCQYIRCLLPVPHCQYLQLGSALAPCHPGSHWRLYLQAGCQSNLLNK